MRKYLIILFFILGFLVPTSLLAQKITVNAKLDSTVLWIGDQAKLTFEVSQQPNQKVTMPLFSDTIVRGLEIVEPGKLDTIISNDGVIIVNSSYVVTSFQDSLLFIPPFPFVIDNDTIWSKSLSLKVVQPFQIDTAANTITDIKPVFDPKFDWWWFLKMIMLAFLIIVILIGLIILIKKLLKKNSIFESHKKEPDLPAHVVALEELDRIKNEKLWQQNRIKEYHTQLTDVIRLYIEKNFDVNSMEMTSDEILDCLSTLRMENKTVFMSLKQILQLADLVKFAKWNALPDENEMSLMNAFLFVKETMKEEIKPLDTNKDFNKISVEEAL